MFCVTFWEPGAYEFADKSLYSRSSRRRSIDVSHANASHIRLPITDRLDGDYREMSASRTSRAAETWRVQSTRETVRVDSWRHSDRSHTFAWSTLRTARVFTLRPCSPKRHDNISRRLDERSRPISSLRPSPLPVTPYTYGIYMYCGLQSRRRLTRLSPVNPLKMHFLSPPTVDQRAVFKTSLIGRLSGRIANRNKYSLSLQNFSAFATRPPPSAHAIIERRRRFDLRSQQ